MIKVRGSYTNLNNRDNWVAIIGSRKASEEERIMARHLASICITKGKIVVSGLAEGIDTEAHKGAIQSGGRTIAVVNTTPEQDVYPKSNVVLGADILLNGSIIYPYSTIPKYQKGFSVFQQRLIERDLLVAYLCPTIIVVKKESSTIVGGTKWAIRAGLDSKKKVFRYDGSFHENPKCEECKTWWINELDINILKRNEDKGGEIFTYIE